MLLCDEVAAVLGLLPLFVCFVPFEVGAEVVRPANVYAVFVFVGFGAAVVAFVFEPFDYLFNGGHAGAGVVCVVEAHF